jgi:N-acetylneuraminate synthase
MEKLAIEGRLVGPGEPPYIVAEIGANHNGDMELCHRLIDAALKCGVGAVKFQSWSKGSLISRAEYERNTRYVARSNGSLTLEEEVAKYQLTPEQHREVTRYCRERGITFFSSCFSPEEVDLLEALGAPAYKIASMDVNHLPLLEYVAGTGKPVILSTGMATLGEIERALDTLWRGGAERVALLHCVSIYPSRPEITNLHNIEMLARIFNVPVGFSDHSLGTSIPLAAVALGACMIEKHFTVDKRLEGWDHSISADVEEMSYLVEQSKNVFAALGSYRRIVSAEELEKRRSFRRRIVTRRAIERGEKITSADLDYKRPGTGIHPDELHYVAGRTLARDVAPEEELEWSDLS